MTPRLRLTAHRSASPRTSPRTSRRATPATHAAPLHRMLAAAAAAAAALVGTVLLGAPPAAAGGPTSVLIVNYDHSRASGALTGSTAYDDLARALDAMTEPTGETRPADDFMSSQIRLTWMIHDVSPWRVDALYLDGKDVWVSTTVSYDGASLFDKTAVWHRPVDADLLLTTLTSLGVIGELPSSSATPSAEAAGALPPGAAMAAHRGPATPATTPMSTGSSWWPLLVATVAALSLGFAAGRAGRRNRGPAGGEG